MPVTRPTLAQIIARIKGDISAQTEGSAFIPRSFEAILSVVQGYSINGVYSFAEWVSRQLFPTTAEEAGLLAWGALRKLSRKAATKSTGAVAFSCSIGNVIPAGTIIKGAGLLFTTLATVTATTTTITVQVQAVDAGSAANLATSVPMTLVSPIAGVTSTGAVASPGLSGGTDQEDLEDYRGRVIDNLRRPPSSGGPGDYRAWALENPGVTRAWEYGSRAGLGTVTLFFMMDDRVNPIPLSGDVATVQAYIDARKPIDMRAVYVLAPIAQPVNMTIALRPNTTTVQATVLQSLKDLFASTLVAHETSLTQSKIDEAISTAVGEDAHNITSIGSLTVTSESGNILTLGTVTFTTLP